MLMKKMEMTRSLICPRRKKFVICRLKIFLTYKVQDDFSSWTSLYNGYLCKTDT